MSGGRVEKQTRVRPFLKWAGGKFRLLDAILPELSSGARLVEPFAGSCAVYLNASSTKALICDINADLISLYRHIQREGEDFIQYCQEMFTSTNNSRERYLELREEFNSSRDSRRRGALLLYLNRHSFNGLVRYNARGGFNVPFGRYTRPYFPLKELREFFRKSREVETEFVCRDFRTVFNGLTAGDVVYCDPPYAPLSATAKFTAYAGSGFTAGDQRDLALLAQAAHGKGIPVLLSNHDTTLTRELYAEAEIKRFSVRRFISRDSASRTAAPELLAIYR